MTPSTDTSPEGVAETERKLCGPHEWGYRCVTSGVFITDDAPFQAVKVLQALVAERDEAVHVLMSIDEHEGLVAKHFLDKAIARAERAEAERDELLAKVYQPGVWRCAKCSFRLVQSNLNAHTGGVSARNDAGDKCPNDGSPMWRVTWREDVEGATKWGEEQFDLRQVAEARVREMEEGLKEAEAAVFIALDCVEEHESATTTKARSAVRAALLRVRRAASLIKREGE